ncbi:MAG TPA: ArsR family transcriptional regulator [Verrucomicrobiales bacterium]|nr:ArsR family transcriptional regulator [Verrucomicrobiales bacterium]
MSAAGPDIREVPFLDRGPRALLALLKTRGPMDARSLAEALEITSAAVRQHLELLRNRGLVVFELEGRAIGRPARVWRLTLEAGAYFFDGHARLAADVLAAVEAESGPGGLRRVLERCEQRREEGYNKRLASPATLAGKLRALAGLRSEEGYDARVEREASGTWTLRQRHCPVAAAARNCELLCECELGLFKRLLGNLAEVRRSEHLFAGDAACAYAIEPKEMAPQDRTPAPLTIAD